MLSTLRVQVPNSVQGLGFKCLGFLGFIGLRDNWILGILEMVIAVHVLGKYMTVGHLDPSGSGEFVKK